MSTSCDAKPLPDFTLERVDPYPSFLGSTRILFHQTVGLLPRLYQWEETHEIAHRPRDGRRHVRLRLAASAPDPGSRPGPARGANTANHGDFRQSGRARGSRTARAACTASRI